VAAIALKFEKTEKFNELEVVKNPELNLAPRPLTPRFPIERVIPGRPLDAINSSTTQDVSTQLLRSKCDKCHTLASDAKANGTKLSPEVDVLLSKIPTVWFDNARFDHAAHRTVSCRDCHAGMHQHENAGADQPKAPGALLDDEKVFLPDKQKCASCHMPGSARSDCAECHRYHAIDKPPHGVGAVVRGVAERISSEEYMRRELSDTPRHEGR
jgi:hypothetical protein